MSMRDPFSNGEDAYSSGHLVLSHLGLAFVLMLRPFFPELVMSTDLLSFEHPSVLLFYFILQNGRLPQQTECLAVSKSMKVVLLFLVPF